MRRVACADVAYIRTDVAADMRVPEMHAADRAQRQRGECEQHAEGKAGEKDGFHTDAIGWWCTSRPAECQ